MPYSCGIQCETAIVEARLIEYCYEKPWARLSNMASLRESYQAKRRLYTAEAIAVITVNLILAIFASAALVRLILYNLAQQEKIEILDAEVEETQTRVNKVREEFSQYFDPQQTTSMMRQQSHRIEAGQARIIFTEPEDSEHSETVTESSEDSAESRETVMDAAGSTSQAQFD